MTARAAPIRGDDLPNGADVVVVGAGIVGTAVAARLAGAGAEVCVVERSAPAAGSSSAGEGNILVSDKLPGPELELARRSLVLWRELGDEESARIELQEKGGLVVARRADQLAALDALAGAQAAAGVKVQRVEADALRALEPHLTRAAVGAVFYEEDAQVQPMHAVRAQAARAVAAGCRLVRGADVLGWRVQAPAGRGRLQTAADVATTLGVVRAGSAVVNAGGPWAAEVAQRLGSRLPVMPRRGHVLVTEPVGVLTPHKVYEADYVGSIHDRADAGWRCSSVVEATASGTMLLGSSREFAGWAASPDPAVVAAIAGRAVALFPALRRVRLLRTYVGFRPATPDRLPVIGWDADVAGLLHATGHEGAGIGLSPATAEAVHCLLEGACPPVALDAFDPARFQAAGDRGVAGHPDPARWAGP